MRTLHILFMAVMLVLGCLAPGRATSADVEQAVVQTNTRKPDDSIQAKSDNGVMILEVRSNSGIGRGAVSLTRGHWPEKVVLRFYLSGLESLGITSGKRRLSGSVLSHSGNTKRLDLNEDGKKGPQDPGTKIVVCDASGKAVQGMPPDGGYFEIAVPKPLLESGSKRLELSWIDFFRR